MNDKEPLPWLVVLILGAFALAMAASFTRLVRVLTNRGSNEAVAETIVLAAGGFVLATVLAISMAATTKSRISSPFVTGVTFSIVTLSLIYLVHICLSYWFDRFGWPVEIQYHGSWLAAIVIVGWPADLVRKRLGIPFPHPKRQR